MDIKWTPHEDAHTVDVTTKQGGTRKLPVKLPFRKAVEIASQLTPLETGAGTITNASEILSRSLKIMKRHLTQSFNPERVNFFHA